MDGEPGSDARNAGFLDRQCALGHEVAADGTIRLAVLVGIAQPNDGAILQLDPAGPLHFEQEAIQRTRKPDDFATFQGRIRFQLPARKVRDHGLPDQPSAYAATFQFRNDGPQIHRQEVLRRRIQRRIKSRRVPSGTAQLRLVITGEQTGGLCAPRPALVA